MDFESYARQSHRALLRYASVLTDDPHLAQDIVHDVLLKAHRHWARVAASDHPHAYVRRMLTNELVSWRRKWARIEVRPDDALDRAVPDMADTIARRDELIRAVRRLPVKQRAAVVMRFFEDMSDDDIADVLGCSPGTVRVHVHRALAALRVERAGAVVTDDRGVLS